MPAKKKPETYADVLVELRATRDAIRKNEAQKTRLVTRRDELVMIAAQFPESSQGIIGKAAGVIPSRVSQIAPLKKSRLQSAVETARMIEQTPGRARAVREAAAAGVIGSRTAPAEAPRKNSVAAQLTAAIGAPPAEGEDQAHVPAPMKREVARELPGIGDVPVTIEHGSASTRKWTKQAARETIALHPDGRAFGRGRAFRINTGDGSAYAILSGLPVEVDRVIMVGPRVWHSDRDTTMTDDVRTWLTAPLADGWTHGSHFPDAQNPVARFTNGKRRVDIQHVGSWVPGTEEDDPRTVWHAFRMLREGIRQRWGTDSVELLGSPKTLGEDLWARTIPQNTEYPLMSQELRELIRTTSGQGRFELRTPPQVPAELPGLHYYDCTFAYAGLTWGMPVGAPTRVTGREFDAATKEQRTKWVRGRGRWHIRVTVPTEWTGLGLLPCSGASGWEYPSEPGRTFTTWAGGSEVAIALKSGWHVEFLDGITWAEGKPLNLWRDKLVECWQSFNAMAMTVGDVYRPAAALAAKMVRSVLLFTVGGFHSKGVAKKGVATSEAAIPATATRGEERGGTWLWQSNRQASGLSAHPEWSAEIYSRMRARLLSGPNGVGALQLNARDVVAFRADGIFTTVETGWNNPDSTPGRFRHKGSLSAVTAPMTEGELLAYRDAAEGAR